MIYGHNTPTTIVVAFLREKTLQNPSAFLTGHQAALPALLDIFQKLDTDESGCITREEIENVSLDMLPPKLLETVLGLEQFGFLGSLGHGARV